MPVLGFGVYQARGDECKNAVKAALQDGYRHSEFLPWRVTCMQKREAKTS